MVWPIRFGFSWDLLPEVVVYSLSQQSGDGGRRTECQPGLHSRILEQVQGMEKRKLRCIKILKMWLAFHVAIVAWHSKSLSCHPQPCGDCHAPLQPNAQSWCQSALATCLSYCKRRTPLQSGKTDWRSYVWRKQEGNIAGCMEMRAIFMHLMCTVYVEKIELEINQNMRHETYMGRGDDEQL